jgi:hypothetical protein
MLSTSLRIWWSAPKCWLSRAPRPMPRPSLRPRGIQGRQARRVARSRAPDSRARMPEALEVPEGRGRPTP